MWYGKLTVTKFRNFEGFFFEKLRYGEDVISIIWFVCMQRMKWIFFCFKLGFFSATAFMSELWP